MKKITNIPKNLTGMCSTFYNCKSLETVPAIPESVTHMHTTFGYCEKLTGTLEINAQNVTSYTNCLVGVATALEEGEKLQLTGSCPQLANIIATKSSNSSIK